MNEEFAFGECGRILLGWKLEAFNEFWEKCYPKREKAKCIELWLDIPDLNRELFKNKILPSAILIFDHNKNICDEHYVGHEPKRFLKKRMWEDDLRDWHLVERASYNNAEEYKEYKKMLKMQWDLISK